MTYLAALAADWCVCVQVGVGWGTGTNHCEESEGGGGGTRIFELHSVVFVINNCFYAYLF